MKIKKNYFYLGKKKQYFIVLSDNNNLALKEAKNILIAFVKKNVKVVFTGFFREHLPCCCKPLLKIKEFYSIEDFHDIELLFSDEYYDNIINLSFYILNNNTIINSKKDINKYNACIYFENNFNECGIIFDKSIYDEKLIINNLFQQ